MNRIYLSIIAGLVLLAGYLGYLNYVGQEMTDSPLMQENTIDRVSPDEPTSSEGMKEATEEGTQEAGLNANAVGHEAIPDDSAGDQERIGMMLDRLTAAVQIEAETMESLSPEDQLNHIVETVTRLTDTLKSQTEQHRNELLARDEIHSAEMQQHLATLHDALSEAAQLRQHVAEAEVVTVQNQSLGREREQLAQQRDQLILERDQLIRERDQLTRERDRLHGENAALAREEQDRLAENEALIQERDRLVEENRQRVSEKAATEQRLEQDIAQLKQSMNLEISKREDVIIQLEQAAKTLQLGSDVAFEFGSATLSRTGKEVLSKVKVLMQSYPDYVVSLEGHTDDRGIKTDYQERFPSNWELSAARAGSAVRYLEREGVNPNRLRIVGFGSHRPVADNQLAEGRAKNRRLEIVFTPKSRSRETIQPF